MIVLLGGKGDSYMRYRISDANVLDTSAISFPENSSRRIETAPTRSSGDDIQQPLQQINSSLSPNEPGSNQNSSIGSSSASEYQSASESHIFDITSSSNESTNLSKGKRPEITPPSAIHKSGNLPVPRSNMFYSVASKSNGELFDEAMDSKRHPIPESSRSRSNAVIEGDGPSLKK